MTFLTGEQVKGLLLKQVSKAGTQTILARELGVTQAYLSDILLGKRPPSRTILRWLGLERQEKVISYIYKRLPRTRHKSQGTGGGIKGRKSMSNFYLQEESARDA